MDKLQDLRNKEVIDVFDGKRLGFVCDCEIDIVTGRLLSLIVPGQGGGKGFFSKSENIVIPWKQIKKIGDDIIIVETKRYTLYDNSDNNKEIVTS
ncbi:MAG: YlmC/YmxH family sporulation protein [Eubacteriales bacterium]|nr:YlmC/YmxH family sporulation protein [Eubacteriales bacterium]